MFSSIAKLTYLRIGMHRAWIGPVGYDRYHQKAYSIVSTFEDTRASPPCMGSIKYSAPASIYVGCTPRRLPSCRDSTRMCFPPCTRLQHSETAASSRLENDRCKGLRLACHVLVVTSFAVEWTLVEEPAQQASQARFLFAMKWAFRVVALKRMALLWTDCHSHAVGS